MKILILGFSLVIASSLAMAVPTANDYSGTWEYTVQTPDGAYNGAIVLSKTAEGYKAHLAHSGTEHQVKNLKVDDTSLQFDVTVDGYPVTIKGDFKGDELTAVAIVEGMELPFVAKRKQ